MAKLYLINLLYEANNKNGNTMETHKAASDKKNREYASISLTEVPVHSPAQPSEIY